MNSATLQRLAISTLLLCGASSQASDLFPVLPADKSVGVQVKIQRFTVADAQHIKATGFGFVRFGVWTNNLGGPAYQKQVSDAFAAAAAAGLPVLMTVRSTKALTTTPGDPGALAVAGEQFADAVNGLEQAYGQQLLAIEIWNEPDLEKYWPTRDFANTFVPFMGAVCRTLGQQPPATPLIGFGFARAPSAGSASSLALKQLFSAYPNCLSAISYHPYGMSALQIASAQAFIQQNFQVPGVLSEWGVSALASNGGSDGQASKVGAFITAVKDLKVPLTSLYEWKNSESGANERERNFGLLTSDGQSKPVAMTVRTLLVPQ